MVPKPITTANITDHLSPNNGIYGTILAVWSVGDTVLTITFTSNNSTITPGAVITPTVASFVSKFGAVEIEASPYTIKITDF